MYFIFFSPRVSFYYFFGFPDTPALIILTPGLLDISKNSNPPPVYFNPFLLGNSEYMWGFSYLPQITLVNDGGHIVARLKRKS